VWVGYDRLAPAYANLVRSAPYARLKSERALVGFHGGGPIVVVVVGGGGREVVVVLVVVAGWLMEVPGCSGLVGGSRGRKTFRVGCAFSIRQHQTTARTLRHRAHRAAGGGSRIPRGRKLGIGNREGTGRKCQISPRGCLRNGLSIFTIASCANFIHFISSSIFPAIDAVRHLHFDRVNGFTVVWELCSDVLDAPPRYTCVEFARLAPRLSRSRESCRETIDPREIAPFYLLDAG